LASPFSASTAFAIRNVLRSATKRKTKLRRFPKTQLLRSKSQIRKLKNLELKLSRLSVQATAKLNLLLWTLMAPLKKHTTILRKSLVLK
jgi:hypothetical protein